MPLRTEAKRVLVGAGARILFYPTLVYNVLRNKTQAEFRWWDEVDQFLLLGAVPFPRDVPRLKHLGVGGVITLNEPYETLVPSSLYHAHGINHLVIPTRDYLFAPTYEDINRAVDFIHRNTSSGQKTYVHCKAGRGRSTTIVVCYLVEHKHMTPASAFEYVRSIRRRVLLHPSQWKAIYEYSKGRSSATICHSFSGDGVLVKEANLEFHSGSSHDTTKKDLGIVPKVSSRWFLIPLLSCLFSSPRFSSGRGRDQVSLPIASDLILPKGVSPIPSTDTCHC
ncbi:hypothetical protein SAY86_009900 [Trapa natans]|uniref:phosphatidylglycerophosphatase n=1 Tax=Trapa natans TaxID=22666 RepID=A0AAN7QTD6_TRANT|nr:hypothetical protein SAY86_009900 [Trapa natans]